MPQVQRLRWILLRMMLSGGNYREHGICDHTDRASHTRSVYSGRAVLVGCARARIVVSCRARVPGLRRSRMRRVAELMMWQNLDFRRLWMANTISSLGTQITSSPITRPAARWAIQRSLKNSPNRTHERCSNVADRKKRNLHLATCDLRPATCDLEPVTCGLELPV